MKKAPHLTLIIPLFTSLPAYATTGRIEATVPQNRNVVVLTIDGDAAHTLWDQIEAKPQPSPNGDKDSWIKRANGVTCFRTESGHHPWISCNFLLDREAKVIPFEPRP